jgi:hypothetical protein
MKKASEYRQHAADCITLAKAMSRADQRDQLLNMANTWLSLAEDRERMLGAGQVWPEGETAQVIQDSHDEISRSRRIIEEINKRDEEREREQ